MANTLNISLATVVGGASFVESVFTVTNGATTISEKHYFYSANKVSSVYYDDNLNIAIIQMGKHQVTLSNGDYSTVLFNGVAQADISILAGAYVADIAQYTT